MRKSAAARDDRWLDRYNSIGALVRSAREKYGKEEGSRSTATDLRSSLRAYAPRAFRKFRGVVASCRPLHSPASRDDGGTWRARQDNLILCNTTEMCTQKDLSARLRWRGHCACFIGMPKTPRMRSNVGLRPSAYTIKSIRRCLVRYLFLGSKISNGERLAKIDRKTGEVILNKPLFAAVEQFIADSKIDCVVF